jgi:hypothetical protein
MKPNVLLSLFSGVFSVGMVVVSANSCPHACSGRGRCIVDTAAGIIGKCECQDGYMGGDCSLKSCPIGDHAWADEAIGVEDAHNRAECSHRGICDRLTGTCKCQPNFSGIACSRLSCPDDCSSRGSCRTMRVHSSHFLLFSQFKEPVSTLLYLTKKKFFSHSPCSITQPRKIPDMVRYSATICGMQT